VRRLGGLLALALALSSGCAWAQGPLSGPATPDVQQQRLLDLKDHREWLEGQLALAKALLNETRRSLAQTEAALGACRKDHEDPR